MSKKLEKFILNRFAANEHGTFGALIFPDFIPRVLTLEDIWLGNKRNMSCIPTGNYIAKKYRSPKFGRELFILENVPRRDAIVIHSGNLAGAPAQKDGHTDGCILVGLNPNNFNGKWGLGYSSLALDVLMDYCKDWSEIQIEIIDFTRP